MTQFTLPASPEPIDPDEAGPLPRRHSIGVWVGSGKDARLPLSNR